MELLNYLKDHGELHFVQKREMAELLGFETRNKFSIETPTGQSIGFAAEQHKGLLGFLFRQFLGHFRRFAIHIFDDRKNLVLIANHPFRFFFQRLEVRTPGGEFVGAIQQRFGIFKKRFDVESGDGSILLSVASPFFHFWTFVFERNGREVARVEKKWSGLLTEMFLDKDRFRLFISDSSLGLRERKLLLAATLFIDLQYFEEKAD